MAIQEIDVAELEARLSSGARLVDVRNPDEWEEARVDGGVLIPLPELSERLGELPDGDLVVICKSGGRSAKACEILTAAGRNATNVAGGTIAWVDSGGSVASGPSGD
jgi:rhodanese-related sulfurtransferase